TLRCDNPEQVCSLIVPGVRGLLDRARAAGAPVIFTGTSPEKGRPEGAAATGLGRQPDEPILYPEGYDQFTEPEVPKVLEEHHVLNVVITGSSTHVAVMYTATTAARIYGYNVVIPLDGVNTRNAYEHEYALHQLQVIPGGSANFIGFSTLADVTFA